MTPKEKVKEYIKQAQGILYRSWFEEETRHLSPTDELKYYELLIETAKMIQKEELKKDSE